MDLEWAYVALFCIHDYFVNIYSFQGVLKVNQFIEVRPRIVVKDENENIKCTPIYSRIVWAY